jgi:hypothetical protein
MWNISVNDQRGKENDERDKNDNDGTQCVVNNYEANARISHD